MKRPIILALLFVALSAELALCQYRPYHREDLEAHKKKKRKVFKIESLNYAYGIGSDYQPQKFQGLQVISMNRPGATHDDVYFIDSNGRTQYHTVRPTAPINSQANGPVRYDSTNPSGIAYESIGQAVIAGVGTLLTDLLRD